MSDMNAVDPAIAPPEPTPQPSEPTVDPLGGFAAAAERTKRSVHRPAQPSRVASDEDYDALLPGAKFIDPEGVTRIKPVKSDEDYDRVPEGTEFVDPEGTKRVKPKSEGIGFTAQMLHDMALTDEGRKKALETIYPGKVKQDTTGAYYVEDNGLLRRPGRGSLGSRLGGAAATTAPAVGMTGGLLLGGAGGTAIEPGGGTAAGAFGGMVVGAMLGRQFNNSVLGLAGIHEPAGEQIQSLGMEGAMAAGGEVVGRGIAAVPGVKESVRRGVSAAGEKLGGVRENLAGLLESFGITPERARYFLGTTPESAERAARITERGGRVPPSVLAPEAPMLRKIEEFDAVFRAQNVFGEAARDYYEKEGRNLLEHELLGVKVDTPLTAAEKKISSERAGHMAIVAAQRDLAHDDAMLEQTLREVKEFARQPIDQMGGEAEVAKGRQLALDRLNAAHQQATQSAERVIEHTIGDIHTNVDAALKQVEAGENSDALWKMVGAQFKSYEVGLKTRAKDLYRAADGAAGDALPETSELSAEAQAFLGRLPQALRDKYPGEIADLSRLAGRAADPAQHIEAIEPETLTFGQLHHLRSWFRHGIDYQDLTPDMREGSLKLFESKINKVLHDPQAEPQLQQAAEMLDRADAFYREHIPFLNDEKITTVMQGLKSGVASDPEALSALLFDPLRTDAMRKVRGIIGENSWSAVQAADTLRMVKSSQMLDGKVDAKKFADQVEDRLKNGLLRTAYDAQTADRLEKLAVNIRQLDGSIPIRAEDGDTVSTLMRRASAAAEEAKKIADHDPIKALSQEMSRLDKEFNLTQRVLREQRKKQPLHFLAEPQMSGMAVRAADKILGSQDLIMAAANQFGRTSPEFQALQQVYVHRFFQRSLGRTGRMLEELGGEKGMTEEVQALMFPGVTRDNMLQLVKDMNFLFSGGGSDIGGSLAAASRVLNPLSHVPIPKLSGMSYLITSIPGVTIAARFALGKLFATIMDGVSHPNFINWLAGNLRGGEVERRAARDVLQRRLSMGGYVGALAGEAAYEEVR